MTLGMTFRRALTIDLAIAPGKDTLRDFARSTEAFYALVFKDRNYTFLHLKYCRILGNQSDVQEIQIRVSVEAIFFATLRYRVRIYCGKKMSKK